MVDSLCGRRMSRGALEGAFAAAWRVKPKWVESRSLKSVGPNATPDGDDEKAFARKLKTKIEGDIDVAWPALAGWLTDLGLIEEYRLYFRPFVHGLGKPYFVGARPHAWLGESCRRASIAHLVRDRRRRSLGAPGLR
jgi:hypothetical protein